jgi:hypothetical protein
MELASTIGNLPRSLTQALARSIVGPKSRDRTCVPAVVRAARQPIRDSGGQTNQPSARTMEEASQILTKQPTNGATSTQRGSSM